MGKPGPRPQPTIKKKLLGNPGRRPLPKNEPEPSIPEEIPKASDHLDELATAEWNRMAVELYPIGVMTVVDRSALEAYCVEYSRWVKATGLIQEHGMVIKAPSSGFPMISPYLQISNKSQSEMRRWLCELGCTPSSRTRIEVAPKKKESALEKFQKKGGRIGVVK